MPARFSDAARKILDTLADEFPKEEMRDRQIRLVVGTTEEHPGKLELRLWPADLVDRVQEALTRVGYSSRLVPAASGVNVIISPRPEPLPPEIVASDAFDRRRKAMELDDRAVAVARRVIENMLVEFRDLRISVDCDNGLVIRERNGTPSNVTRISTRDGLTMGISAYLAALHAIETGEV